MVTDLPEGLTVGGVSFSGEGQGYGSTKYRNSYGNAFPTVGNGNYWMTFSAATVCSGSFSLAAADEDQAIQLETLTFDWIGVNSSSKDALTLHYEFRVDLVCDGVTTEKIFFQTDSIQLDVLEQKGQQRFSVDLSAYSGRDIQIKFVDLNGSGSTGGGGTAQAISNVQLNGTLVSIPEPSFAVMGLAGLFAVAMRRRRNRM